MPTEATQSFKSGHDRPPLGQRIRDRRRDLDMTLKEVADQAGLSVGFISQVERDLTAPSLSSLASIAKVLDLPVTDLLSQPSGASAHTRGSERAVYGVKPEALNYERISASFEGSVLNSLIIHEPPGHRSEPIRHEGEELFFVLSGSLTVELEDEMTVLSAGDSIHFQSTREHSTWNHTTEQTTILHVCTMDVFGDNPSDNSAPGNHAGHGTKETSDKKNKNSPTGE